MFVSLVKLIKCTDYFYDLLHFFFVCIIPITRSQTQRMLGHAHAGSAQSHGDTMKYEHSAVGNTMSQSIMFAAFSSSRLIILFCKSFSVKFDRELCWKKKFFLFVFFNAVTVNRTFRAFLISSPLSTRGDSRGRKRLSKQCDYL